LACGSVSLHAQAASRPNSRQGFWIGLGVGNGSAGLDCRTVTLESATIAYPPCSKDRFGGLSGYVRLGGTLSRSVLLGFEINGWLRSENGGIVDPSSALQTRESIGYGSVILVWYPSRTRALYLKAGLGEMKYRADDGEVALTATAPSALLGMGYEMRLGRNFSLVPYLNSLASSAVRKHFNDDPGFPTERADPRFTTTEDISVTLVQLGLGVTWH